MDDIYTLSDTQLSKRIGEKLKAIRLKRNITQQSLAEAASISLSSVKKVENGEIGSFDTLLRILRTLGMLESISQLFEEEQLSPSEYYEMVNKAKKQTRKRAVGKLKVNKEYMGRTGWRVIHFWRVWYLPNGRRTGFLVGKMK